MLSEFEKQYTALDERMPKMDEAGWQSKGKMMIDGKLYREASVGELLWYVFFDGIHHRVN
jgi:hypothetical protein